MIVHFPGQKCKGFPSFRWNKCDRTNAMEQMRWNKKLRSRICSGNAAGFYSLKIPVASRMIRIKTITSRPDTTQITLSIVFTLTWM